MRRKVGTGRTGQRKTTRKRSAPVDHLALKTTETRCDVTPSSPRRRKGHSHESQSPQTCRCGRTVVVVRSQLATNVLLRLVSPGGVHGASHPTTRRGHGTGPAPSQTEERREHVHYTRDRDTTAVLVTDLVRKGHSRASQSHHLPSSPVQRSPLQSTPDPAHSGASNVVEDQNQNAEGYQSQTS